MIAIVIVNWNSGTLLAEAITSISKYHQHLVTSVIIVDNASTDNSLNLVKVISGLPFSLNIIKNTSNKGFGAACNQGANLSDTDYILFLNPDARLMDKVLDKVIDFFNSELSNKIGICGVRLLDENGNTQKHCARYPKLFTFIGKATGLSKLFPRKFPSHFLQEFDHLSNRVVDQVIGAFFVVRSNTFKKLNGFDERYFVYYEEMDFSLRAHKEGWNTYYLADAIGYHLGGGTSSQVKAHRLFYSLRSRLLYGFKHFTPYKAWALFFVTLFIEPFSRCILALSKSSWGELAHTIHAYKMLYLDTFKILKISLVKNTIGK